MVTYSLRHVHDSAATKILGKNTSETLTLTVHVCERRLST